MATTYYHPERTVDGSSTRTLQDLTDNLVTLDTMELASAEQEPSPLLKTTLPNPRFAFPAAPPSPSSTQPLYSRATGRRPMSAVETHSRPFGIGPECDERMPRHAALPAFSFNPGAALPLDSTTSILLSPPITPNSLRAVPSPNRPAGHGHRRGGSEFVGGRLREGNSIAVLSTSPTKLESGFTAPTLQPPPRRGHRRGMSGAISTNDLPILLPPDIFSFKGSSAPNSPTTFDRAEIPPLPNHGELVSMSPLPEPVQAVEQPSHTTVYETTVDIESGEELPKPSKGVARARVGFSDTLEFIPRPLSLVSSDTSSTTTARPGHSVSGSISSIVSAASPGGRDSPVSRSRNQTGDHSGSRPSTAGAILDRSVEQMVSAGPTMSPKRRNSIPALLDLSQATTINSATPSPTKASKRWSFFGSGSPTKARPTSSSSSDSTPKAVQLSSNSDIESDASTDMVEDASDKSRKDVKKGSKKKKVKGWAGSILPLKAKSQRKKEKMNAARPPTPPASETQPDDEEEEATDASDVQEHNRPTPTVTITESINLPQKTLPLRKASDDTSPMIDLDAALGPFNTPLPHNAEWEAAQRAAGNSGKRRLHSAQGMKGFSGPGMHYHRRAESAPDLPPFDPGRFAIHRFGSSSTMADVFEEEEEGDDGSTSQTRSDESDGSDGDTTLPAAAPSSAPLEFVGENFEKTVHLVRRRSSGLSDRGDQYSAHSIRAECSRTSLQENVIVEEPGAPLFPGSSTLSIATESVDSAAPSPRRYPGTNEAIPNDAFNLPSAAILPLSPYSMSHASSFPSPRSPMSIDAQRISTAPSSVTDENSFHSLLMGEPGPEVRISVDYDIPSLTSSNSTMTRDSTFIANPRVFQPSHREPRPMSVSSAAFGRRRSSLVSLSRLISSSHGERSKLSMEVTLDNDVDSKRSKDSRTKRLGRMMQFWKPSKDGEAT